VQISERPRQRPAQGIGAQIGHGCAH
jgi:hypothetical protein